MQTEIIKQNQTEIRELENTMTVIKKTQQGASPADLAEQEFLFLEKSVNSKMSFLELSRGEERKKGKEKTTTTKKENEQVNKT